MTGRRGDLVMAADLRFLSGKGCSACGTIRKELRLGIRQRTCPDCGPVHDRDVNAAKNLLGFGLAALNGSKASSAECEAWGEEGSGRRRKTPVDPASVKQEVSFEPA